MKGFKVKRYLIINISKFQIPTYVQWSNFKVSILKDSKIRYNLDKTTKMYYNYSLTVCCQFK